MANVQRRLPGAKWSEFSTKQPRQHKAAPSPPQAPGQAPGQQPIGGPAQPLAGMYGGATVGPNFAIRGLGKYVNPQNTNGNQFNMPGVKQAVAAGVRSHTRSQYFRRAGFGAALRYTLGMEQTPSHVNDYLNARTHGQHTTGNQRSNVILHEEEQLW